MIGMWNSRSAGLRLLVVTARVTAVGGWLLLSGTAIAQSGQSPTAPPPTSPALPTTSASQMSGPIKIVQLLWSSNPGNAASTLTRSIATAVERDELDALGQALSKLESPAQRVVEAGDASDPRFGPALAVALLRQEPTEFSATLTSALPIIENREQRQMLWRVWLLRDLPAAQEFFTGQLSLNETEVAADSDERAFPTTAQRDEWLVGCMSDTLASQRGWASKTLLEHWQELSPAVQVAAIEPLTATAESMDLLLSAIEQQRVSKDLLNTNQLRKWLSREQPRFTARIEAVWGQVRLSDDTQRQLLVAQTLEGIGQGAQGSVGRGRLVFDRVCSQCHILNGRGFEVGPNIAGNGRGNLQQLVSNILDPSLVIGEAFQAKTVLTVDGEVVSGLVAAENERYLKLKIQGGKIAEFDKDDIEQVKTSEQSLMPVGVEAQMQAQELLDLLAYLCLLQPAEPLPVDPSTSELIPGTPPHFVQP